jgi:hypothetical protein
MTDANLYGVCLQLPVHLSMHVSVFMHTVAAACSSQLSTMFAACLCLIRTLWFVFCSTLEVVVPAD